MKTIKKASKGSLSPKSSSVSSKLGSYGKKMKEGGSLGMKSVKAGYDKNPSVTRADIIVAAKKEAKKGMKVKKAEVGQIIGGGKKLPGQKVSKSNLESSYSGPYGPSKGEGKKLPTLKKLPTFTKEQIAARKSKTTMKSGGKMTKKCKYGCK